jgi:hypothetical protein
MSQAVIVQVAIKKHCYINDNNRHFTRIVPGM